MQQAGFLEPSPRRPATLATVVAVHVALLAAVMLSSPKIVRDAVTHLRLIQVNADPPPPKPDPEPQPKQARTSHSEIDVPKHPLVDARPDLPTVDQREDPQPSFPLDPPGPATGGDVGGGSVKAEPAPPVLTGASLDPRYADRLQPPYPPSMERLQREGTATVRVLIGADGRVKQAQAVSATDPAFAEATVRQALRSWRFRPATRDGVAEESWKTLTVRFVLSSR